MLLKITRINSKNETVDAVIDTTQIVGITQNQTRVENLYDENGDVVETRELPRTYTILFRNFSTTINETTYQALLTKLAVETL